MVVMLSIMQAPRALKFFALGFVKEESDSKHKLENFIQMMLFSVQAITQVYFMHFLTFRWDDAVELIDFRPIMKNIKTPMEIINKVQSTTYLCTSDFTSVTKAPYFCRNIAIYSLFMYDLVFRKTKLMVPRWLWRRS